MTDEARGKGSGRTGPGVAVHFEIEVDRQETVTEAGYDLCVPS